MDTHSDIKELVVYDYPPISDSRTTIGDFLGKIDQMQIPTSMGQSKMHRFLHQHGSLRIIIHPTDDKEKLLKQLMAITSSIYELTSMYYFSGTPLKVYWANGYCILTHQITSNDDLINQMLTCCVWIYENEKANLQSTFNWITKDSTKALIIYAYNDEISSQQFKLSHFLEGNLNDFTLICLDGTTYQGKYKMFDYIKKGCVLNADFSQNFREMKNTMNQFLATSLENFESESKKQLPATLYGVPVNGQWMAFSPEIQKILNKHGKCLGWFGGHFRLITTYAQYRMVEISSTDTFIKKEGNCIPCDYNYESEVYTITSRLGVYKMRLCTRENRRQIRQVTKQ